MDKAVSCRNWRVHIPPSDFFGPQVLNCHGGIIAEMTSYAKSRADAQAICAAMNALPALIRIVKAVKNDDLRHEPDIYTGRGMEEHAAAWDELDKALAELDGDSMAELK